MRFPAILALAAIIVIAVVVAIVFIAITSIPTICYLFSPRFQKRLPDRFALSICVFSGAALGGLALCVLKIGLELSTEWLGFD
jgi:predicted lysophospholipase L1 biosynthesis ABC-type transport system permease subunit